MNEDIVKKVKSTPHYHELISKRKSFSIKLSIAMLVVYFAFILVIAFEPSIFAITLSSDSVVTVGIPIGIFVIVFAFGLTGIYTKRANAEFDDLTRKIKEELKDVK